MRVSTPLMAQLALGFLRAGQRVCITYNASGWALDEVLVRGDDTPVYVFGPYEDVAIGMIVSAALCSFLADPAVQKVMWETHRFEKILGRTYGVCLANAFNLIDTAVISLRKSGPLEMWAVLDRFGYEQRPKVRVTPYVERSTYCRAMSMVHMLDVWTDICSRLLTMKNAGRLRL